MTNRVHWTCPGCQKTYAVPDATGLTVCPACRGRSLPSRFPHKATAAMLVGIILVAGWLWWSSSRSNPISPIAEVMFGNPEKRLVETWLRENLDDGKWEEVRWWPAFEVAPHLKAEHELQSANLQSLQAEQIILQKQIDDLEPAINEAFVEKRKAKSAADPIQQPYYTLLREREQKVTQCDQVRKQIDDLVPRKLKKLAEVPPKSKVARMRFRTKSVLGGNMLRDMVFLFDEGKVIGVSTFREMPLDGLDLISGLREPLGFLE